VKEEAIANRYVSGATLAEPLLIKYAEENPRSTLPKLKNLARIGRNVKNRNYPDAPTSINFHLNPEDFPKDFFRGDFVVPVTREERKRYRKKHPDGKKELESRMLLFATDQMLHHLANSNCWYVDGTFQIIGKPFKQLFGIHCYVRKGENVKLIPVMFVAMSRRREVDYCKLLQEIKNLLRKRNIRPKVTKIVADFESAFWQAVQEELPSVTMMGCSFHWTQCVFKKLKGLGLTSRYRKSPEVRKFCRQLMSLHLLPPDEIVGAFNHLHAKVKKGKLLSLCAYIKETWIESDLWDPWAWSVFMESIRTNNTVEGFHNRLKSKHRTNLDIYHLVDLLYEESKTVSLNVLLLSQGQVLQEQKKKIRVFKRISLLFGIVTMRVISPHLAS